MRGVAHTNETHIGIEMSDSHTTFSIVRAGKKPTLVSVDRRVLLPGMVKDGGVASHKALVEILAPLAAELSVHPQTRFSLSIPTARITSHVFTFPADFSRKEIDAALASQADEYFPYLDNDRVMWARKVGATEQTLTMFVCAASQKFIRAWTDVFMELGMPITFLDIEPVNILRSITTRLPKYASTMVIDIGRRMTYISVIDSHGIRDLRVLSCPIFETMNGSRAAQIDSVLQSVAHEASALLNVLVELYDMKIESIVVCGFGSRNPAVINALRSALSREVVQYTQVTIAVDASLNQAFTEGLPFEYANSVGVALGGISHPDFAPVL